MKIQRINSTTNTNNGSTQIDVSYIDDNGEFKTVNVLESYQYYDEVKKIADELRESRRNTSDEHVIDDIARRLITAANKSANVIGTVNDKFISLGALDGRMKRKGNRIFIDYEPIDPTLEQHLISVLDSNKDADWESLVKFIENLYSNDLEYVRTQLFSWLEASNNGSEKGFTITTDGCLIGYKSCNRDKDGHPVSTWSGFALVNGEERKGYIDNSVGNVIEMPRKMVTNDPQLACAPGLHIGTYDYASVYYAHSVVLTVKFNPRDVVSIPADHNGQKLRACRYEVIGETDTPYTAPTWFGDDDDDEDDYNEKYYDEYGDNDEDRYDDDDEDEY
jgi:hypothetical protein